MSSASSAVQRAAALRAQQERKHHSGSASTSSDVRIKPDPDEPLTGESSSSVVTPMEVAPAPVVKEEEIWPPVDFDPNAPVSLPFGPTDPRTKSRLAAQPTFAPAHDAVALEKEEQEDIFLLQFPFMLPTPVETQKDHRFTAPAGAPSPDGDEDPSAGATPEDDSFTVTPDMLSLHRYPEGRLGKMQVMSDGSMRLWIGSSCYEVHNSLRTYFAQELASINAAPSEQEAAAPTNAGNGHLSFLGQITKKVVVTPKVQF